MKNHRKQRLAFKDLVGENCILQRKFVKSFENTEQLAFPNL